MGRWKSDAFRKYIRIPSFVKSKKKGHWSVSFISSHSQKIDTKTFTKVLILSTLIHRTIITRLFFTGVCFASSNSLNINFKNFTGVLTLSAPIHRTIITLPFLTGVVAVLAPIHRTKTTIISLRQLPFIDLSSLNSFLQECQLRQHLSIEHQHIRVLLKESSLYFVSRTI